jgi:hypothetical protein
MAPIRTSTVRLASGLAAAGLLVVPLSGCSGAPASGAAASTSGSGVDCAGASCSITLDGVGTEVDVLGNTVPLGQVQDGRVTIGVGDREVSCSQGESVSAGPLTLECTTVTADVVTLTASLG